MVELKKETRHEAEERLQKLYKEAAGLEGREREDKIKEIKEAYVGYMRTFHPNEPLLTGFYASIYSAVPRGGGRRRK